MFRRTAPEPAGGEPVPPTLALYLRANLAAQAGDVETALALASQVIADPNAPLLHLSVSHSLRGAQLHRLGRPIEALAAAQAATDAARRLGGSDPDDRAVLVRALTGEAAMLTQSRRLVDAQAASREALALARALPAENRDDLATALNSWAGSLMFLGHHAEALPVLEELLDIRRGAGDRHELALTLGHLARLAEQTGDLGRGLDLGEEELALLRATGALTLAFALNAQAGRLGRRDPGRALELADEALAVAEGVDRNDADVRRCLAASYAHRAICLRAARRVREQVESARRAVSLRREIPEDLELDPAAITGPLSLLADGLLQLSIAHAQAGEFDAALAANAESLDVFRELEVLAPGRHGDGVGLSLTNRGNMLLQSGRPDEAAGAYGDAIDVLRAAASDPVRDPQLALALTNLTAVHLRAERFGDALTSATEAAEIRERLHEADPASMAGPFANSVNALADAFLGTGQLAEARAMAEWGRDLLATVPVEEASDHDVYHAASADTCSRVLAALGDTDRARREAEEAVALARTIVRSRPGRADLLARMEQHLAELGG